MKKEEILQQIDKLKLMVLMSEPEPTEQEKFHDWIRELQGRLSKFDPCQFRSNEKYSKFSLLRIMVEDLFTKEFRGTDAYEKMQRLDYKKFISEVVAMTMFYEEEYHKIK